MGLAKPALRFIAREHKRKLFTGPILTLGRQNVYATLDEVRQLLISEGITPTNLPSGEGTRTNIPSWFGTPYENNTSDVAFFRLLGATDIMALDYSNFENAEIVHNLNYPVPDELCNRFDLIVDGGTIEHVFDVRQSLMNIALMLKPGGRIIHLSPASNYVNHGFYQFSPTLFYDYYAANDFVNLKGFIVEHDIHYASRPWEFFEVGVEGRFASNQALATVFVAEKSINSTVDKVPMQSYYTQVYISTEGGASRRSKGSAKAIIKRMLPDNVKSWLKRSVPRLDPTKKPWRLKRWDRLS